MNIFVPWTSLNHCPSHHQDSRIQFSGAEACALGFLHFQVFLCVPDFENYHTAKEMAPSTQGKAVSDDTVGGGTGAAGSIE